MKSNQKHWNEQQKHLRIALKTGQDHQESLDLFLAQHSAVHTASVSGRGAWTFEDEVWQNLDSETARRIPPGGEHSIAWLTWHMARIEDVTMNLLVAHSPQLFVQKGWSERLKVTFQDTGNASDTEYIQQLSSTIDLQALRTYRLAVGRRTRQIVSQLSPIELKTKVAPSRLQLVAEQGAVSQAASDVLDYWGGLTIAGLLLMPPTRHNFIHLNEALRIKQKITRASQG